MANHALIEDLLRQYAENPRRVFARLANELRKSGDYDRAIEICRGQIPQQPGYISGHIVLGQSLYDCGRLDEARQTFETALNLDPENLIALRHLGDIARQHGENQVAKGWYRRLLEVDPQNDEVVAQLEAMGAATQPTGSHEAVVAEEFSPNIDLESLSVPAVEGAPSPEGGAPATPEIEHDEFKIDVSTKSSDAVAKHESLEIETAEAFQPSASAEKAFPDLEQSLEVSGIGPEVAPRASTESQEPSRETVPETSDMPQGGEPRDAVDAYYPMLDVQATTSSPAAFVTETMAELYLQQGYVQEALDIYRQLAAQNPSDESLRERVRQLEQGSRSSIGMAAISDNVAEMAQKRATAKPKKTIRSFFAKLAMRRVVEREVIEDVPPERRRAAPELDEPAWLRSDPEPETPAEPPNEGGFALLDETEWNAAAPRTPAHAESAPPPAEPQGDVPWLAGYEPDTVDGSPAAEGRPQQADDPNAIPPSELFPSQRIPTEDENAAATLASVFEPSFLTRMTPVRPMESQRDEARPPAAEGGATRKAEEELSLDQIFGRTPTSGAPQTRNAMTFDQFVEQQKEANRESGQDASSEIELFNTWLDQLKK